MMRACRPSCARCGGCWMGTEYPPLNLRTPGVGLAGPGGAPLVSRLLPAHVSELECRMYESLLSYCQACGARLFVASATTNGTLCAECQEIES